MPRRRRRSRPRRVGEGAHLRRFQDRRRRRARDDAPEHAGPGLDDRPALLGHPPPGRVGGEQATDRLGRVTERGSSASTSTWVSTATARSGRSCAMSASSMARHSRCPMPPCESATASHSGSSGSLRRWRPGRPAPRRRMKPTCGPLPCVTSTCHRPRPARRPAGRMPPTAPAGGTTARLALVHQRVPADRDQHDPWLDHVATAAARPCTAARNTSGGAVTIPRRSGPPRPPVRDPGVDQRQLAGVEHLEHVDAGRAAGEVQRRQREGRVRRQRDPAHRAARGQRVGRCAADEGGDRR